MIHSWQPHLHNVQASFYVHKIYKKYYSFSVRNDVRRFILSVYIPPVYQSAVPFPLAYFCGYEKFICVAGSCVVHSSIFYIVGVK